MMAAPTATDGWRSCAPSRRYPETMMRTRHRGGVANLRLAAHREQPGHNPHPRHVHSFALTDRHRLSYDCQEPSMPLPSVDHCCSAGRTLQFRGHEMFVRIRGQCVALLLIHGFPTASWDWCKLWPE